MRQLLLLLLMVLLFSQCSTFSRSYGYNNSRNDNGTIDKEPERRERPLYEPVEKEEEEDATPRDDDELDFESETEEEEAPLPKSEAALRLQVIDYAKQHLGTKYKYGGNTPKEGFDCSGFTRYVMDQADVGLPRTSQSQEKEGEKVRLKKVRPGDLIFYRRTPVSKVFHVSIVVENNEEGVSVIHSTSRGVVIDNITESSYWSPKISSARNIISQ